MNPEYDYLFKLLLIGDSGVGKSCLLLRFAKPRAGIGMKTCTEESKREVQLIEMTEVGNLF